MNTILIKRAVISVSDKLGLDKLARSLTKFNVEFVSTGGTAEALRQNGHKVVEVSEYTHFPELLGGRVKTLHPKIHSGILSIRDDHTHVMDMQNHSIPYIDLVVANLYPFERTVASGKDFETCIENIDIGGPTLIRAAAKNYKFVTVIVDPSDYESLFAQMEQNNGSTTETFRQNLAAKAFSITCQYDAAISDWFSEKRGEHFPKTKVFIGQRGKKLRYGENPHQKAIFYEVANNSNPGVASARQLQGKELSYNNINDTDAAFELVSEFSKSPACVIVKHANPSGAACAANLLVAYNKALKCDPESAFGGIIAFNRSLDEKTALTLVKLFAEVIIAPKISEAARKVLAERHDLRVLETGRVLDPAAEVNSIRSVAGGYLCQKKDALPLIHKAKIVTKIKPSKSQFRDLLFAFTVAKHVKSNAIVYAKNNMTVGIGAGQMSRVNSSRIAAWKAAENAEVAGDTKSWAINSVVASDAFFPFADGVLAAAEAGAKAVIQPGGSIRDKEIIQAADDNGLAMVFTNVRHFRH